MVMAYNDIIFDKHDDRRLYDELTHEIRCLVCQNQTIADSQSHFALAMRERVASMVRAGQTQQAIEQSLRQRYGDKVLFVPSRDMRTWLLWYGPYSLLALLVMAWAWRRRI